MYSRFLTWLESRGWSAFCRWWIKSRTHRVVLAVGTFLACQRVSMDVRDQPVGINCKLSLKGSD